SVYHPTPPRYPPPFPPRRSSDLIPRERNLAQSGHFPLARFVHDLPWHRIRESRHFARLVFRQERQHATRPRRVQPQRLQCRDDRSEEHTSELQSRVDLVCRLLLA